MSTVFVEVVEIDDVRPHPNADRLEVVVIRGATVASQKGTFTKGQLGIYFPPDILIPENIAEELGVKQYLKHAIFPGQIHRTACRVAACRLRGQPSFGFVIPVSEVALKAAAEASQDVSEYFQAVKYEPPVKVLQGDLEPELPEFHRYTDIEHFWRYPNVIQPGELVRITEKIHGTNSRVGCIKIDDEFQFIAGSHKTRRKPVDTSERPSLYWQPLEQESVLNLINDLCDGQHNVLVFGEIFGAGVQDMDYAQPGATGYRVFDISVDGKYLDWPDVDHYCTKHSVDKVPLLFCGPFAPELVQEYTYGATRVADPSQITSAFKDREGCVITPITERHSHALGRVTLKSVSADYLDRKGAKDEG